LRIYVPSRSEWAILKGKCFSDFCDIQCGVTELLKGVPLQVSKRALEDDISFVWIWVGTICWKFLTKTSKCFYTLFRSKCNLIISEQTLNARRQFGQYSPVVCLASVLCIFCLWGYLKIWLYSASF
jgi:hypothetical protein